MSQQRAPKFEYSVHVLTSSFPAFRYFNYQLLLGLTF